jgi:hypothetical protein
MNQKLAKQLRRLAKKLAENANITTENSYNENSRNRKKEYVRDADGKIVFDGEGDAAKAVTREISAGTITVDAKTVKGIYNKLKKTANNIKPSEQKQLPPVL